MEGALAAGTVLAGRYEIVEVLDRGGHGAVYRAKQRPLGREVAVKVMLPEVAAGPGMSARFAREVSLVQRLEHPNTVRLYDFGATDDGTAFMVFELLRGPSLESEMAKGPMPPPRVAKIAVQILKSLMEAHALGIVHRDVKPANVLLVDYSGEPDFVKVLDFGVARTVDEVSHERAITRDGQLVGTPAYMAPEQVKGESITARTDLYALGLLMGEMLAGQPIFDGVSAAKIWMQQASAAPVPIPERARASVLGEIVERATQKDAQARFASAAEMVAAIEHAVRSEGLAATDPLAKPVAAPSEPRKPAATAPFVSAPPPPVYPVQTSVLPAPAATRPFGPSAPPPAHASTPLVQTRPPPPAPSGGLTGWPLAIVVAAGIFGTLVMLGVASQGMLARPQEPHGTNAPPLQERNFMESPFHLPEKIAGAGWSIVRTDAMTYQAVRNGGDAYRETYLIRDTRGDTAVLVVVRLKTESEAETFRSELPPGTQARRESRHVLFLTGLGSGAFGQRVFARLTS